MAELEPAGHSLESAEHRIRGLLAHHMLVAPVHHMLVAPDLHSLVLVEHRIAAGAVQTVIVEAEQTAAGAVRIVHEPRTEQEEQPALVVVVVHMRAYRKAAVLVHRD